MMDSSEISLEHALNATNALTPKPEQTQCGGVATWGCKAIRLALGDYEK